MKKTTRRTKPVQPVRPADLSRVIGGQGVIGGGVGTTPLGPNG